MKRKLTILFIIIISFLIQSTILPGFQFASVGPNLLLIVTASFSFMRGRKEGMAVGLTAGLFIDLFWGTSLGFHMLLFTIIGYMNGSFQKLYYDEDIKLPLVLIGISEFLYGVVTCFCIYVLRGDFEFMSHLMHIIIPELVYTILATLILYQIILHVNKRLEAEEQRSASKFV
ncbi:rod shape-determining protein MreD [Lachnospiraceae bacterium 42-17]|jgi:rod shape-determining protein MreD|nr:rod shape-determining protein MreD [Dorea sp.]